MKKIRKTAKYLTVLLCGTALLMVAACILANKPLEIDTEADTNTGTESDDPVDPDTEVIPDPVTPGGYTATAQGFLGTSFTVTVEFDGDKIKSITSDPPTFDSPEAGAKVIPILISNMLKENTAQVDIISGASTTSRNFINAVKEALIKGNAPESLLTARSGEEPQEESQREPKNADILVIGSGISGFSAAIQAKTGKPGATVIIIEKQPIIGGSTKLSAGVVTASLDNTQAEKNDYYNYLMTRAQGNADTELVRFFADNSYNTLSFLGISTAAGSASGTSSKGRMRSSSGGSSIIQNLSAKAKNAGVIVMTDVEAKSLVTDSSGTVVGVKADSKTVNYIFNVSGGVVIATGGFDSDRFASDSLMQTYNKDSYQDQPQSNSGSTGDGIKMGIAIGADTVFKGGKIGWLAYDKSNSTGYHYYTAPITGDGTLVPLNDIPASAAGTNNAGQQHPALNAVAYETKRDDYAVVHSRLLVLRKANPEMKFWAISNGAPPAGAAGFSFTDTTIAGLAKKIGADTTKLQASFASRQVISSSGTSLSATSGTFTAVKIEPSSIGSMGGLKINTKAEVIRKSDQKPIPGLYAAGEAANGQLFYLEYPGSGTSLSVGATFGRTAGAEAAKRIP